MPLNSDDKFLKEKTRDKDLDEAIGRVYERYGNDLSSFFRDAQEQVRQDRSERGSKESWTLVRKW